MVLPERFSNLPEYAFARLRNLLRGIAPGRDPIVMAIGEPRHDFPGWVGDEVAGALDGFRRYPANDGTPALRDAIARWVERRYGVTLAADRHVLPLNGSREGLFNACLALCPEPGNGVRPAVLVPNPSYPVYAVAALAAGAEPIYAPATPETGDLPDFAALPPDVLDRAAIAYVCSPANPQGAVADRAYWNTLLRLAERHDFKVFSDECYSEIYRDVPPPGALTAAGELGVDPERVVLFNSLSKRSNLAGLRSGFAASGPANIAALKRLRAYAGAPLPMPLQAVAARAWDDEAHVAASRALYREKYAIADTILGGSPGHARPEAGFFLWLEVADGEAAAVRLWREAGVKVLPGAYLAHAAGGATPGSDRIRVAMTGKADEMRAGLERLEACLYG